MSIGYTSCARSVVVPVTGLEAPLVTALLQHVRSIGVAFALLDELTVDPVVLLAVPCIVARLVDESFTRGRCDFDLDRRGRSLVDLDLDHAGCLPADRQGDGSRRQQRTPDDIV